MVEIVHTRNIGKNDRGIECFVPDLIEKANVLIPLRTGGNFSRIQCKRAINAYREIAEPDYREPQFSLYC